MNDSVLPYHFYIAVSVCDVEAVREGHQSEVLQSLANEFPPECCFTLVFRGRQGNLDLVAETAEEAQAWVQGLRTLIENMESMDDREKLDQYPYQEMPLLTEKNLHSLMTRFFLK